MKYCSDSYESSGFFVHSQIQYTAQKVSTIGVRTYDFILYYFVHKFVIIILSKH